LKLSTVVVVDTASKPVEFGFKRSVFRVRVRIKIGVRVGV